MIANSFKLINFNFFKYLLTQFFFFINFVNISSNLPLPDPDPNPKAELRFGDFFAIEKSCTSLISIALFDKAADKHDFGKLKTKNEF